MMEHKNYTIDGKDVDIKFLDKNYDHELMPDDSISFMTITSKTNFKLEPIDSNNNGTAKDSE